MSEQAAGTQEFAYQGVLPERANDYGFKIERKQVEHFLPVNEVFPYRKEGLIAQETQKILKQLDIKPKEWENIGRFFPYLVDPETDKDTLVNKLADVYDFSSWGEDVQLLNFGSKRMTDEQLAGIANALRAVGQVTGGKLFEKLSEIYILPEGHPLLLRWGVAQELLQRGPDDISHIEDNLHMHGRTYDQSRTILINEHVLSKSPQKEPLLNELPPGKPPEISQNHTDEVQPRGLKNFFFRHREVRRQKERRAAEARKFRAQQLAKLPYNAGPADLEHVLVHELHHILSGWWETASVLGGLDSDELPPSQYADLDHHEDIAETGSARFAGGVYDALVGPNHRKVYEEFLKAAHSKREGPTFVTCRELDPHKIR